MAVSDRLCLIGIFLQLTIMMQSPHQVTSAGQPGTTTTSTGPGGAFFGPGGKLIWGKAERTTINKNGEATTIKLSVYKPCEDAKDKYCDENKIEVEPSTILDPTSGSTSKTVMPCLKALYELPEAANSETATTSSNADGKNVQNYERTSSGTYVKKGDAEANSVTPQKLLDSVKLAGNDNEQKEGEACKKLEEMTAGTETSGSNQDGWPALHRILHHSATFYRISRK